MSTPEVTVIIANYKTPELTRLCLRLLRMHTAPERYKVIVVDNDSQDESLEYLRGLRLDQAAGASQCRRRNSPPDGSARDRPRA